MIEDHGHLIVSKHTTRTLYDVSLSGLKKPGTEFDNATVFVLDNSSLNRKYFPERVFELTKAHCNCFVKLSFFHTKGSTFLTREKEHARIIEH